MMMILQREDVLVLPVAKCGLDIGAELGGLPPSIAALAAMNARVLHDDLFDKSVEVVSGFIQRHFNRGKAS